MISQIQRGFTLVELMIVIAIIGILAASLFPSLTQHISRAQDARVRVELRHIVGAFEDYMMANHTWVLSGSYGGGSGSIDYDPTLVGFSLVSPAYAIGEPSPIRELEILGYIKPGYIRQTNDPNLSRYMIDGCGPATFSIGAKVINQTNSDADAISYACNGAVNIFGTLNTMSRHSIHPMNTAITRGPCTGALEEFKNCEGLNLVCINGATNYPTCDNMPF